MKAIALNLLVLIAVTFLGACRQSTPASGPQAVEVGNANAPGAPSAPASLPAPRPAMIEGAGSTGGGDVDGIFLAEQDRYRQKFGESVRGMVLDLIGKNRIRDRLTAFLKVVDKDTTYDRYRLRNRELVAFLQKYTKGELILDVTTAKYEARERCMDSNGVERGLSTGKGSDLAPLVGATICVNHRKIEEDILSRRIPRRDIASYLVGLFLHDHLRHFGVEDEDHRMAEAYRLSYAKFQQVVYLPTPELDETYTNSNWRGEAKNYHYFVYYRQESDNSEHVQASPPRPLKLTWKLHPDFAVSGVEFMLVRPDDHNEDMITNHNIRKDKFSHEDFLWDSNLYKIPRLVPGTAVEIDPSDFVIWGSSALYSNIQPYLEYLKPRNHRRNEAQVTDSLVDGFLQNTTNNWEEFYAKHPKDAVMMSLEVSDQDGVVIEDLPLYHRYEDPEKPGEYEFNWDMPEIEFGWKKL